MPFGVQRCRAHVDLYLWDENKDNLQDEDNLQNQEEEGEEEDEDGDGDEDGGAGEVHSGVVHRWQDSRAKLGTVHAHWVSATLMSSLALSKTGGRAGNPGWAQMLPRLLLNGAGMKASKSCKTPSVSRT